jgi:hypothetical protein
MPHKLFNVDHQPVVVNHDKPAVMPGEAHVFTDEQFAAGVAGAWSENDPRAGLKAEKQFKKRRDAAVTTDPAEAGHTADSESADQSETPAGEKE